MPTPPDEAAPAPAEPPQPGGSPERPRRRRGGSHRRPPGRLGRLGRRVGLGLCVAAILAGLGIGANIGWFYLHSATAGAALVRRQKALDAAASSTTLAPAHTRGVKALPAQPTSCRPPKAAPGAPRGLVEAPSIGLQAPVLQGVGDAQLAVAVGHVPASAWPGTTGTVVLSAHDVSWFSHIDALAKGAAIRYVTPCQTLTYRVTGHRVVPAGSPVLDTASPRLVLVTCYPLDALYITPKRYLVYARLATVTTGGHAASLPPAGAGSLSVPLPASLAASLRGTLTTTAPLGTLQIAGSPSPSWTQSLAPIHAEESALTMYFGALRLAEEGDTAAWQALAPGVPPADAAALRGATVSHYVLGVSPTLTVSGSTVTAVRVDAGFRVAGGPDPGTYHLTVAAGAGNGTLTITAWRLSRG